MHHTCSTAVRRICAAPRVRRSILSVGASCALLLALVAPVTATTLGQGPAYEWRYAELSYASEAGAAVYDPGLHSRLTVRFSVGEDENGRTNAVQVVYNGWATNESGGMDYDWYEAYEEIVPLDPSLGSIDGALRRAWVDAGPIALTCYSAYCPALPDSITLTGIWSATGPAVATTEKVVDDLGWTSNLMRRARQAVADVDISPAVPVPAILVSSVIVDQEQVALPKLASDDVVIDFSTIGVGNEADPLAFEHQGLILPGERCGIACTDSLFVGWIVGDDALVESTTWGPLTARFTKPVGSLAVSVVPGEQGTVEFTLSALDHAGRVIDTGSATVIMDSGDPETGPSVYTVIDLGTLARPAWGFSIDMRSIRSSYGIAVQDFGVNLVAYHLL